MATQSQLQQSDGAYARMPKGVRRVLFAAVGVLLAGALYLIAVRGQALLVDLSALSQRIFCF